jgi:hypothetical protein
MTMVAMSIPSILVSEGYQMEEEVLPDVLYSMLLT